ncbi:hypothetical protein D9M72_486620 [compost metagenome]
MHRQDRQAVFARKAHRRRLPRPLVEAAVRPVGDAPGREEHRRLALADRPVGHLQRLAGLQLALVLLTPFDGDDHLDKAWIDADGVAIGKEHHVRPPCLEQVENSDTVGYAGRMVADEQEAALGRNALGPVNPHLQREKRTQMFEGLEAGHVGDRIGELVRLAVVQQCVEKRSHQRPHRALDDALPALGNQGVDDVTRFSL